MAISLRKTKSSVIAKRSQYGGLFSQSGRPDMAFTHVRVSIRKISGIQILPARHRADEFAGGF
jgi:hypothetical protein